MIINPSYPTPMNGRGHVAVPEMPVGGATLPLLAALVESERPDCDVRIYDEIGTPIDFDYIVSLPRERTLILMSVRTNLAFEARKLAKRFQSQGFAVVMGGPHVSACQTEVASYANAAVHGEAELHMKSVIEAFESGAFDAKTLPGVRFRSAQSYDLSHSPVPHRHLYKFSKTTMHPGVLEFGRGCQYRCTFCASTNLYTDRIRHKPIAQILAEISTLPTYPGGFQAWFFADDNFPSSHPKAIELSQAIGRHYPKARWGCAMTIASAGDRKLLDAMVKGGMRYAFIGFDSIVQKSLAGCQKTASKVDHFSPLIAELKARGVFIVAALVFGFDHDKPSVFESCLDWAMTTGVDVLNLNVLRPYPSSPMYQELQSADRLLVDPWWLMPFSKRLELVHHLTPNVSGVMTTFHPRHMSAYELAAGTLWLGQQFYKLGNTLPRLLRNRSSLPTLVVDALTAASYAREYRSWAPVDNPARSRRVGSLERSTLVAANSEVALGNG